MKSIAVIPAYNEEIHLQEVLDKVRSYVSQVIVIDDGSSDSSFEIADSMGGQVIALQHEINLGKGAALKTGCDAAKKLGADYIICMDADNQHKPESIPKFLDALVDEDIDIVFGARQFNKDMPFMMFMGNRVLSVIINKLFHIFVHDTQSGYRAFTVDAYDKLKWESSGYEAETEMIVRASEYHLKYAEVDIDTIYHDDYKGTTAIDGIKILLQIIKWKLL
ncbi:MAG: glycosyltransferase family 2 protein [bacterium]|nr:glycosyltransferase family 2 protein [bacterium]